MRTFAAHNRPMQQIGQRRYPGILRGAALLLLGVAPLGVAVAVVMTPPAQGAVAAVFPPWWGGMQVFAAASGAGPVLRQGAVPFVIIVAAADRARLHEAGAWLLLDPVGLAGCAPRIADQSGKTTL